SHDLDFGAGKAACNRRLYMANQNRCGQLPRRNIPINFRAAKSDDRFWPSYPILLRTRVRFVSCALQEFSRRGHHMSKLITNLGYICPKCQTLVCVISSAAHPPVGTNLFRSQCECGYKRLVPLEQIQELEIWWEERVA